LSLTFGVSLFDLVHSTSVEIGEQTVLGGSGKHIVLWLGEEFDVSHLRLNPTFGLSPFAIVLTHPDAPLASVLKLYSAVRSCMEADKAR
jgi:hypothetical protein